MEGYIDSHIIKRELDECIDQKVLYSSMYTVISTLMSATFRPNLEKYLVDNQISKVVIYGAGCIGRALDDALKCLGVCDVVGVVDGAHNSDYGFREFLSVEELSDDMMDLCIVTPINAWDKIAALLDEKGISKYCNIMEIIDYPRKERMYGIGLFD